jgi:signal transduction histidine kinase
VKALRFLIADDSPANLRLLHAGLESEGHQVFEAINGEEALALLEREPVDAVISDILMPSMDGFRLCREIRSSKKHYSAIPLILYTSTYDSPTDRALADSVGADGYVLKPAPATVLICAVLDVMRKAPGRHAVRPVTDEHDVRKLYNAALVLKLETRSREVQESLADLRRAHNEIIELNQSLEDRVAHRTAALDAANKELEAFSFSVSHDLQSPLHSIAGFAQLLKKSASPQLSDEHMAVVGKIIDASAQMSDLIAALLSFARVSRTEMHFRDVDLNILVDKAIADLHIDSAVRIIEWRRAPLPSVTGDAILLYQVLVNLLSNAAKFTRTREHAVIEIGAGERSGGKIVVFVRDNGVGFDPRYAGKLFEVFQRMHRAEEFEGTGIGLANAQRIVTRHGGSMWAEAARDRGATFYFSLPLP